MRGVPESLSLSVFPAVGQQYPSHPGQGREGRGRSLLRRGAARWGVGVQAGQATRAQAQGSNGLNTAGLPVADQSGLASTRPGHGHHVLETPRARGWVGAKGCGRQGQSPWRGARGRRAKCRDRARGRPITLGRGSHWCRRRRATHGRGRPRVTALKVRLRSGCEVWVSEPSCPTMMGKSLQSGGT